MAKTTQSVILMEHVSKTYEIGASRKRDLKSSIQQSWFNFGNRKEEFFALRDINLNIHEGDVWGIIGANGSGKSTLLKLLARVSAPSEGRILIRGKLSAMLEVRIGFHPELTGWENIFLYGALMGMSRSQIKSCLDSIVEFSGLEKFLSTPLKRFSSGMYVKLAFAVAIHLPMEILLLDEVLNFIDLEFQEKCIAKLTEFKQQGRTMIMVSHQLPLLNRLCSHGIFMDQGAIAFEGNMGDTIETYRSKFA
jgi:lipopolysaccharide transport system ATP-binding protein